MKGRKTGSSAESVRILRFRQLEGKELYDRYLSLLGTRFNPDGVRNIRCRSLTTVDWEGGLYNCDFSQAIGLPMTDAEGNAHS